MVATAAHQPVPNQNVVLGVPTAHLDQMERKGLATDTSRIPIWFLNKISSSRYRDVLEVTDAQVEEYYIEKIIDFWTEPHLAPYFNVDYDGVNNVLSVYIDDTMEREAETIFVNGGASCWVSVSDNTKFVGKWDNPPVWWIQYTVYRGNDTTNDIIISGYSGHQNSIYLKPIPE